MEPSSLVGCWALTLCLCSYDARFSGGVQVVAHAGVLRFGHVMGCVCCGVPPLSIPLPRVDAPAPLFGGGAPVSCGGGVFVAPPLCCGYPTICVHPLGLHPFGMPAYTRAIGTTRKELPDEHYPR
nr:MAG TPA: hypothetical protein [Caudoviricetes sp.]